MTGGHFQEMSSYVGEPRLQQGKTEGIEAPGEVGILDLSMKSSGFSLLNGCLENA